MRQVNHFVLAALALVEIAFGGASMAHAGFVGNTVHGLILFPNTSTVFSDMGDPAVTGTGDTFNAGDSNFRIDFTNTTITIIAKNPFSFATGGFNGFGFENTDGQFPTIANVMVDGATDQAGFVAADVFFDANDIFVNDAGLSGETGDKVVLDVTFAGSQTSVPEPTTIVLFSVGLFGLGALRRR